MQASAAGNELRESMEQIAGYTEDAAGKSFLAKGMEIITKPFTTDVLATKLREMIENGPRG